MRLPLLEAISKRILLCDGGMGTLLFHAGLPQGWCPEEWNVSHPEVVKKIHLGYFDAGSDIVLTNTFGGNKFKLEAHGQQNKIESFNRSGVRLARQAAGADRYVLGDMGSCGGLLEPYGDMDASQVEEAFFEQAKTLASEDIDGIIIETMSDLGEAKLALKAALRATSLPVIVSLTYQPSRDSYRTLMGQKAIDCAFALKEEGAAVVGSNCGVGSMGMVEIVRELASAETGIPLLAEPNAGLPIIRDGETVYPETPSEMGAHVREYLMHGVRILGGCCGTTPDHIRAFRRILDENNS